MSEANRTFLAYIKESTEGTTPGSGNFTKIPFTAAPDFSFNPNTVQSSEIRSDRQIEDLSLVGIEAGGSVEIEFSYGRYDDLIRGALFNEWSELQSVGTSQVSAFASGGITFKSGQTIPTQFKQDAIVLIENGGQSQDTFVLANTSGQTVAASGLTAVAGSALNANLKITVVGAQHTGTSTTINDTSITIDEAHAKALFPTFSLKAGDWIALQTNKSDRSGYYRVKNAAAGSSNIYKIDYDTFVPSSDFSLAASSTHDNFFISKRIHNGTSSQSYSILQGFEGLNPVVQAVFSGCKVGSLALNFETQAIITGSFNFLGLNSKYLDTNIGDSRIKDVDQESILNSSSNVGNILVGGSVVQSPNHIQSGSLNVENNVRRQNAVGSIGSVGLPAGTNVITGALTTYFGTKKLAQDVINNTESSYVLNLSDKKKRRLIVDLPRIKFNAGSVGIPGSNTDLVLPLEYQALRHSSLGYQIKLCAFPFV